MFIISYPGTAEVYLPSLHSIDIVSDKIMKHKIIFVGGIHGVGKSTFSNSLASRINARHFSASDLILMIKKVKITKNKRVYDIHGDQDILLNAINENLKEGMLYIIDGHFCLINKNGEISKVPEQTYKSISPMAIVMLYDEPSNIYDRLDKRDNEKYSFEFIKAFQEQELNYSKYIADNFGIPYISCNPFTEFSHVYKFIGNVLEKEIV
jgi:adenylate kinase